MDEKNRVEEVKIGLIDQEVCTDESGLRAGEIDCLDIRPAPTVWRVEDGGKSNPGTHSSTIDQSIQAFIYSALQPGQDVYCQDGYAGKVVALRLSPQSQYKSFVVQTGRLFRHRFIVPSEWLDRIESDSVYLSAKKDDLKALPKERPDPVLVIAGKRALREEAILRGAEIKGIDVSARYGFISLNGYVPDSVQKARAEKATRRIPGVLGVENCLVVDEDLKSAVARAVAQIQDILVEKIFVSAQNGFILLMGEVSSVASRTAAEELASNVAQIRGVLNALRVAGLKFSEPHALQPRIGAKVHGRDIVSGHVEQVIINPINRLVTAIVVDGMFLKPSKNRINWFLGDSVIAPRKLVIPVQTIRHQTDTAVFLEIEASQFEDFNPTSFALPDANWRPPYPYHHKDVLLYDPVEAEQDNPKAVGVNQISKVLA